MTNAMKVLIKRITFIGICVTATSCVVAICRRWYSYSTVKGLALSALIPLSAYLSACIMYLVENGGWGGISLFGGLLLMPLWSILFAKVLRLPYKTVTDVCAPAGMANIAVMKINCLKEGCCRGIVLSQLSANGEVRFPSQAVEFSVAAAFVWVILVAMKKGKWRGMLYPYAMLMYCSSRFFLDLLRETEPFLLGMSAGCFWSIVGVILALVWVYMEKRYTPKTN